MCENWQVSTFLVIFNLNMNYFLHNIRININQIALGKAVGSERKVQTFESSHMQVRTNVSKKC